MALIVDYLVQEYGDDERDRRVLHREASDVIMRLFRSSGFYRQLILDVTNYMSSHLDMTFTDYPAPRGVSGPCLGIPWNIIGYKLDNKNKFCINPRILAKSADMVEVETNCGSFRLEKPLKVMRHALIDMEYFDLKGVRIVERNIDRYKGGLVIQHEIEHLQGVCITDLPTKEQK